MVLYKDSDALCKRVVILQPAQKHNINKERKTGPQSEGERGGRVNCMELGIWEYIPACFILPDCKREPASANNSLATDFLNLTSLTASVGGGGWEQ